MLTQVKETIMRPKNQNKPKRKITKTLRVAKSTFWYFFRRRNALTSSSTPKGWKDHRRQPKWKMTGEKIHFSDLEKQLTNVKNTLEEVYHY